MKYIVTLTLAFFLTACTLLEEQDARLRLAVEYTTLKVIESSDVTSKRVIEGVKRARSLVETDAQITVESLVDDVRSGIRWDELDNSDRLLLDVILVEVETELKARVGDGFLSADDKVAVTTLLNWIERAARLA